MSINVKDTTLDSKLDTYAGGINNNLAQATVKLQTYAYGFDSANSLAKPLKLDSSGRLECSVDALEVTAETINLSTDQLEALITNSNTKLDTLETTLTAIETDQAALEVLHTATNSKLDTIKVDTEAIETAVEVLSASDGGKSTSAKQDTIIGYIDGIEGKLDTLETTLTAIETDQAAIEVLHTATNSKIDTMDTVLDNINGKLPSSLNSDNLKVVDSALDTAIGTLDTNNSSKLDHLSGDLDTLNGKIDTLDAVVDAAEVHLGNIDTGIDVLEACVGSNKVNVNISSGNITGFSTASNQSTIIGHLDGVEGKLDTLETTLTAIETDQAAIEVLLTAANTDHAANEVLLTACDQKLGDIETSIQTLDDIVLAEDAAHSSGQKGVMFLGVRQSSQADFSADGDYTPLSIDDDGKLRVTSSAASGGSTEAKQDTVIGHLDGVEGKLDALETTLTAIETDQAAIEVLLTAANGKHAANETLLGTIDSDTDAIKTSTAACATDLAAIEVLLTAANTDHAANEVLLTGIDSDTDAIKTSTAACATDLAAIEVLLTAANVDHDANETLLTQINQKLGDIETAIQLIDNGYGDMTTTTLFSASVNGSGGTETSSVFTKTREIENIGFSIAGASHGSYTAVIQYSVDNSIYHDDTNLNFGNAQNCKGTITSIGRGFRYYRVFITNNGATQNTTVKISY